MKKLLIITLITIFAIACASTPVKIEKREKILVAGSYWDSIAIIDKQTKAVEWAMALPPDSECNSVGVTEDGNILFSYKNGARLIDRQGKIIWDYTDIAPGAELQTAVVLGKDSYMVAICGTPIRIVELDGAGKAIKEVRYDSGIEKPHSQFRKIAKSKRGTYLLPIMSQGTVIEIDEQGKLLNTWAVGGNPFSLVELENDNLLVSCGNGHYLSLIDRTTGLEAMRFEKNYIPGVELQFVTEAAILSNGNTMISNWLGYHKGRYPEPQLVEIDNQGALVWFFDNKDAIKYISAICPFTE